MKKIIRLTESDLTKIVRRIIKEESENIKIPYEYYNVREMIGDSATPEDIKELFNELLSDDLIGGLPPIVGFDGKFFKHEDGDENTVKTILFILQDALFENDEDEYEDEEDDEYDYEF